MHLTLKKRTTTNVGKNSQMKRITPNRMNFTSVRASTRSAFAKNEEIVEMIKIVTSNCTNKKESVLIGDVGSVQYIQIINDTKSRAGDLILSCMSAFEQLV